MRCGTTMEDEKLISDIIVYIIMIGGLVGTWLFFSFTKRKRHHWYEVDSADVARSHRLGKKKKEKKQ